MEPIAKYEAMAEIRESYCWDCDYGECMEQCANCLIEAAIEVIDAMEAVK